VKGHRVGILSHHISGSRKNSWQSHLQQRDGRQNKSSHNSWLKGDNNCQLFQMKQKSWQYDKYSNSVLHPSPIITIIIHPRLYYLVEPVGPAQVCGTGLWKRGLHSTPYFLLKLLRPFPFLKLNLLNLLWLGELGIPIGTSKVSCSSPPCPLPD